MPERARFTILSMMKDEGHSLLEWVAYHRVAGFDRICVYTNDCRDGTDKMLIRLQELGLVHHFRNDVPEGKKPQPNALSLADNNDLLKDSDWILTMDADEFLSVKCGEGRVSDLVDAVPTDSDAIAITWRFFGSSGLTDWNPGLVTENYTQAAPDQFKKGWGVKTLFRPFDHMKFGIHRPSISKKKEPERARQLLQQKWVNGSGVPMPAEFALSGWRSTKPTLGYDLAEMNHYAVKSYEAYLLRRIRGNVNNKADKYNANYFAIFDRNETTAPNVQRLVPETRALMAEMLADPVLAELSAAALAFHARRVEKLRKTPNYAAWLKELEKAARVPIARLDEILFTQHLPREWQERVAEWRRQGVPDRVIALAIARSQTARKGETRAALKAAAEGHQAPATPAPRTPNLAPTSRTAAQTRGEPATPTPTAAAIVRLPSRTSPRIHLVTTVKNEGPYLVEWLAYHRMIGVTDVTVFSNDCTDGTNLLLNRMEQLGLLTHYDNPIGPGMDPQRRAYSRAGKMARVRDADYVLVIDADEFLNIRTGDGTLPALIDTTDGPDAISINWRLMGSSGHAQMEEAPVTARFTRGSDFDKPENGMVWGFKTLFRPTSFDYFGVHRPRFYKDRSSLPDIRWLNGSGTAMGDRILTKGWRSSAETQGHSLAQVNHYAVKSRAEFLLKRLRGTANSKNKDRIDLSYWRTFDLNTHEDRSLRTTGLTAAMDQMLADPDIAVLHRATLENAVRVIAEQLQDPLLRAFVETGALPEAAE